MDSIIFDLQKHGGISVYWKQLIKNYTNKDINIENITENSVTPIMKYMPYFGQIKKKSIFHSSYYRYSNRKDVFNIITVYDFIYEKYRGGLPKLVHGFQKKRAIDNASGVICISESTKKDLLEYYPEINQDNIKVIHLAPSENYYLIEQTIKKNLVDGKYILFVGQRGGYKNFFKAIDIVSELNDFLLVIVGGGQISKVEQEHLDSKLKNKYIDFGYVDEGILNQLYNSAFCLLYPSTYEGFGIPVLEAMRAGCPVVAANKSSIPEVAGNNAMLSDAECVDSYVSIINELENNDFRKELVENGIKHSKLFTWEKCASETLQFYEYIHSC